MPIEILKIKYARSFVDYELTIYQGNNRPSEDPKVAQVAAYFGSTPARHMFGALACAARMDRQSRYISHYVQQLGRTLNAVNTMINECDSYGWISVTKDAKGWRMVEATEFLVDCWVAYADWHREVSRSHGLTDVSSAMHMITTHTDAAQ